MGSSIFNSSAYGRITPRPWGKVFLQGLLLTAVFFTLWEISGRALGFKPTVFDNYQLWSSILTRALEVDEQSLIFIGASRNQADIHIPTIRRNLSTFFPAQLSTGNGSPLPALELIADYTTFRGTLVIDVMPSRMFTSVDQHRKLGPDFSWPKRYQAELNSQSPPIISGLELEMSLLLQETFILVSGVLGPPVLLDAFKSATFPTPRFYWITRDRLQVFDYSLIESDLERYRQSNTFGHYRWNKLINEALLSRIEWIHQKVTKILDRGGRIIFLRFPVKGGVLESELARFPDNEYWDVFAAGVGGQFVNANKISSLSQFKITDGDHIDSEFASRFTEFLIEYLNLKPINS